LAYVADEYALDFEVDPVPSVTCLSATETSITVEITPFPGTENHEAYISLCEGFTPDSDTLYAESLGPDPGTFEFTGLLEAETYYIVIRGLRSSFVGDSVELACTTSAHADGPDGVSVAFVSATEADFFPFPTNPDATSVIYQWRLASSACDWSDLLGSATVTGANRFTHRGNNLVDGQEHVVRARYDFSAGPATVRPQLDRHATYTGAVAVVAALRGVLARIALAPEPGLTIGFSREDEAILTAMVAPVAIDTLTRGRDDAETRRAVWPAVHAQANELGIDCDDTAVLREARETLRERRGQVQAVAAALLSGRVLSGAAVMEIIGETPRDVLPSDPNLSARATHEAGHALMACVLGMTVEHVNLSACQITAEGEDVQRSILIAWAGAAAEQIVYGNWNRTRCGSDAANAARAAVEAGIAYDADAALAEAVELLHPRRRALKALAKELRKRGELSGTDAVRIMEGA
jgi:hypothetical protein